MTHFNSTENVFEVIGNYPVVDQFDVVYTEMLTGSIYDRYITGSLVAIEKYSFEFYSTTYGLNRGRVFSKTGVSYNAYPHRDATDVYGLPITNVGYKLTPWRERSGGVRNARLFSVNERSWDSYMPTLQSLTERYNADIYELNATDLFGIINLGDTLPSNPVGNVPGRYFPMQGDFARVEDILSSFVVTRDYTGATKERPRSVNALVVASSLYNASVMPAGVVVYNVDGPVTRKEDTVKALFGFAKNSYPVKNGAVEYPNWPMCSYRITFPAGFGLLIGSGPIIDGWRYGLFSGTPYYSSVVYRRGSYGQFRDMLEQRPIFVGRIDAKNGPCYRIDPIEGGPGIAAVKPLLEEDLLGDSIDWTVKVSFKQSSVDNNKLLWSNVSPTETWSSNLSQYATSSLPYFDGKSYNRPEIDFSTNVTQDGIVTVYNI